MQNKLNCLLWQNMSLVIKGNGVNIIYHIGLSKSLNTVPHNSFLSEMEKCGLEKIVAVARQVCGYV